MGTQQPVDPRVGSVVHGRYEIRGLIAEGAMGAVYEGVRVQIGRPVAVKFLHRACASNRDSQRRFEREAVAMSKLSHPNCVAVIDFGVDDAPYIVMDLVDGSTVRELIDREELTPARCLSITLQMLAGLGHAHDNQLVHRDVKPANVKVGTTDGGADYVRVLDFGLAKLTDANAAQLTEEGIVAGTTTYMSPEHACGQGIDARSDLYSAGLVLFEMLTGRPPYESETAAGMLLMHRDRPAPPLSEVVGEGVFSEELEQVVAKALAKDKADRFATAAEFSEALSQVPEALEDEDAGSSVRRIVRGRSGTQRVPSSVPGARGWLAALRPTSTRHWVGAAAAVGALGALGLLASGWNASRAEVEAKKKVAPKESTSVVAAPAPAPAEPVVEAQDPAAAARVEQLLMRGEHEAALLRLQGMLEAEPTNAELHYFAGTAYFEVRRWDDGVASYAAAIENDPEFKSRPLLNRNVIRALRNQRTHDRARELILNELRSAAVPHLQDYAEHARNDAERESIQALLEQLSPEELAQQTDSPAADSPAVDE